MFSGLTTKQPKLEKFAIPSQNLPKKRLQIENKVQGEQQGPSKLRRQRLARRQQIRDETSSVPISERPLCDMPSESEDMLVRSYNELNNEEKVAIQSMLLMSNMTVTSFVDKGVQVSSGDFLTTFSSTIIQKNQLNSLTGIKSFELLNVFTERITKSYPDKKVHKLTVRDRIILTFMKLKMALKLNVLSFLFKISPTLCKSIFVEYINYLGNILADFVYWPSFNEIQENMPVCFENFKSVRIVLDCIEIPIENPKCLCCRVRTYSHYKGKQTIKIMTGISPAGVLTFVSKPYGGRSSDKAIFEQSGLIKNLFPFRDSVMVDKGFLIDSICAEHNIKIIRPHFLRKKKTIFGK